MSINWKYVIFVGEYSKKHFIKPFSKRYKTWDNSFTTIEDMLSRIDRLILSSKAEKIHNCDIWYIAKSEFKIVWSNESPKTSWNRIIVFVNEEKFETHILLLYWKNDVWSHNETTWWEQEIKNNYEFVRDLFPWL